MRWTPDQDQMMLDMLGAGATQPLAAVILGMKPKQLENRLRKLRELSKPRRIVTKDVLAFVAMQFGVKVEDIVGPSRVGVLIPPRFVAVALCQEFSGLSLERLETRFNRDHTTLSAAARLARARYAHKLAETRTALLAKHGRG